MAKRASAKRSVESVVEAVAGVGGSSNRKLGVFMTLARTRFRLSAQAESQSRLDQLDDRRFRASKQWRDEDIAERQAERRPYTTINRIPQFLNQVINQARASKPGIKVVARGGGASQDAAEVLQGWIRDVEVQSDADIAYVTAAELQAEIGLGFIKVTTEFSDDPDSDFFTQEARIKRVRNRFSVYLDPGFQTFDGADLRWSFECEDLEREEYDDRYGEQGSSLEDFRSIGDQMPMWLSGNSIRIAHYHYAEDVRVPMVLLEFQDGARRGVKESDVKLDILKKTGVKVLSRRTMIERVVRSCVIDGVKILEGADNTGVQGEIWPSPYIPIVPIIGAQIDLDGQVDYRGMVRDAKDPCRSYNFWITAATEMAASAPKAPWVMAEGQDEGYEDEWRDANIKSSARLIYTPVLVGDQLAPPPQRNSIEPPIAAFSQLIRQSDNDIKATMGFYEPSLGMNRNDQSGKAILALQKQGEIGNSQYLSNWGIGIRHVGRILISLTKTLFQEPRVIRTVADDGVTSERVLSYPGGEEAALAAVEAGEYEMPEGVTKIVDLSKGIYDVITTVGPSFKSKREEAVATLGELISKNAELARILGDLWVGNMDAPWSQEASTRLKKMLPPELQDTEGAVIPPEAQQQMQQMQEQLAQMVEQLRALSTERDELQQKLSSKELDAQTRKEIEQLKQQTTLEINQMKLESNERIARMEAAFKEIAAASTASGRVQPPPALGPGPVATPGRVPEHMRTVPVTPRQPVRPRKRAEQPPMPPGLPPAPLRPQRPQRPR